jgi:Cu-Zn family superoxide dismutase
MKKLSFLSLFLTIISTAFAAKAVIQPVQGNYVTGIVTFDQTESGILVQASLTGLWPGTYGFHIFENGNCSGLIFNPGHEVPGNLTPVNRMVGNLGYIVADQNGNAAYNRVDHMIEFSGQNSILGRSVIIHSGATPLGCGIIQ